MSELLPAVPVSRSASVGDGPAESTDSLLDRYDRPVPRYTSYPPVPAWSPSFGETDYRAALIDAAAGGTLSLYVHLPFCPVRCLYCACNVELTRQGTRIDAYLDRLEREMDLVTAVLGRSREVSQLHLGGGTPNYLSDRQLERLAGMLMTRFRIAPDADTAIELDPRLASPAQIALLHRLGFRRASFGVQDLDPGVQEAIGRLQSETAVRNAVAAARDAGFSGINMDLIYGLPRQTPATFRATIDAVIELAPDRVACFGYAHVPAMQPHQRALERFPRPAGSERYALMRMAVERFEAAGYEWIGLDHFARPGDSLAAAAREGWLHRNFNGYTTLPAAHLIGFGASAIGDVGGRLVQNHGRVAQWQAALDREALPVQRGHRLTADDRLRREVIQRLMCDLQLPLDLGAQLEPGMTRLLACRRDGLVEPQADRVRVTRLGRFFLRTLASLFDAYLPDGGTARPMSRAV
ncbi:MAG TPA: oxygen-independent coproporphyrinogen III oxidase [Gemmatimonadales bacterium]|nr:oxygen-independent coproporphyrinogen III oxidase [Gemmatimonadales bacterium]